METPLSTAPQLAIAKIVADLRWCIDADHTPEGRMTRGEERLKVAAQCVACAGVYAAWQVGDGTISLIGMKEGCSCGETEFRVVQ